MKKNKYITLLIISLVLIIVLFLNFQRKLPHRISLNKSNEFLYFSKDIALRKQLFKVKNVVLNNKLPKELQCKSVNFSLVKSHYDSFPDYKYQTGDVVNSILEDNIIVINIKNSIIYGVFRKKNKYYFSYNITTSQNIIYTSLSKLCIYLKKNNINYTPVLANDFFKQKL
jgi:hypothetical protein